MTGCLVALIGIAVTIYLGKLGLAGIQQWKADSLALKSSEENYEAWVRRMCIPAAAISAAITIGTVIACMRSF